MSDLSPQLASALTDRYELVRELGRGGMATVYLARDTRHDRLVAVKMLDAELAASVGAERFLAEIRLTAQLHHPNILALYDSGAAKGLLYYVMPYIAGETLRARLDRERQLPVSDAVQITTAVASALEHAHKAGVVHRDLKPENILLDNGEPMVADFGIALAVRRAANERLTLTGISLGTPQYMSPEQATGDRVIDARSDVFSLGCVLYEMLAGEPPFTAPTAQATIARILTERQRELTSLRASVPAHVSAAVDRALEKLPADRWTTAQEFAHALADARAIPARAAHSTSARRRAALPWIVTAAAVAAAITAIIWPRARPPSEVPSVTLRFPIAPSDSERVLASTPGIPFAISPDERRIAYIGPAPRGRSRVYVRSLNELRNRPLTGTEGIPLNPTFSADGRWVALTVDDKLVKTPVEGGPITTILPLNRRQVAGLTWFADDTLLASIDGSLILVPASGGTPRVLSRPDTTQGETAQWGPHLIGHDNIVYISVSREGTSANRIGVLSRKTGRTTITARRGTTALGVVGDRVVWVMTSGVVMAAPIDAAGSIGDPTPVLDGVLVRPGGAAKAVLSQHGSLLYERGEALSQLVSVDQRGLVTPLDIEPKSFFHPRVSPDGSHIATGIATSGRSNIWIIGMASKTFSPITSDGLNAVPEWSPDGARVLYRSAQPQGTTLQWQRTDGRDSPTSLVSVDQAPYEGVISRDAKWLVYRSNDPARKPRHTFYMPLGGAAAPHDMTADGAEDYGPRLSSDDKWLAFCSIDQVTGVPEVIVTPFPGPGPHYRVSIGGGTEPMWSRDGHTLFYRNRRAMLAATIATTPSFSVTSRQTLFEGAFLSDASHSDYDVMPDGKHFLMVQSVDNQTETVMVHGWANELLRAWAKQ